VERSRLSARALVGRALRERLASFDQSAASNVRAEQQTEAAAIRASGAGYDFASPPPYGSLTMLSVRQGPLDAAMASFGG
jgi:hypothetical protein